ncbi:MAG: tyrosine--tRNA ligase [Epsilonproteobacteria bacterium]|nr:MAG: tyrosine--tRNA ligase [Campylobacterota bacterium]RLA66220.1 MAG: tyrosine--tRNA ligase [Campylobacterota bacterium]
MDPALEKEVQKQLEYLKKGVSEITPEDEFVAMLRKSIDSGVPLRVKCGIDPTSPDVHLGHTVPFRKMRHFQNMGHIGTVIIGDYTASIGDPSGKNESRPPLSEDQIKLNSQQYMDQMYMILDKERTEVSFQSEWFEEVSLKDVIRWASQTTVAKLLSHETFRIRLEKNLPLSLHELFYPVLQGIDSVYVKADVELGGTDQKFNVLMGRDFQKLEGLKPQVAMLLPIITGTCGSQKMSKSLGNYIGILDEPFDKFGKVMSIPDEQMCEYYELLTETPLEKVSELRAGLKDHTLHPNELKKNLASMIVDDFHDLGTGQAMREQFENVFKKKKLPDDIPEFAFQRGTQLVDILFSSGLLSSKGEVRRMVKQNAVSIVDGDKITNAEVLLDDSYAGKVIKVGKRKFLKLI